jgi:hypothetical protein
MQKNKTFWEELIAYFPYSQSVSRLVKLLLALSSTVIIG